MKAKKNGIFVRTKEKNTTRRKSDILEKNI